MLYLLLCTLHSFTFPFLSTLHFLQLLGCSPNAAAVMLQLLKHFCCSSLLPAAFCSHPAPLPT